ncbi:FCD domain-containing protein [Microbispora sp. H10836]|uniref:GntR family transcriptional regulator n=1 Tax=Microbispora sp. H10836 TaxID=2729106 RepID=UPI001B8AFD65|nr:FCD domain-containing protein [Microbispora sp. H10836]
MVDVGVLIRDAIISGEFAARQRLVEADLSERFGASRMAVRTVLLQLTTEGLVERTRTGVRGCALSPRTNSGRLPRCGWSWRRCAQGRPLPGSPPNGADALAALGEAMETAVRERDLLRYRRLDHELHGLLRSGHSTAQAVVDRIEGHTARSRFRLLLNPDRLTASLAEHLRIVEAVCAGDEAEAADALRAHLTAVLQAMPTDAGDRAAPAEVPPSAARL